MILRNAIEAPCQGRKKKITLECTVMDEEVQLIVNDNGDGIPPDISEQMFTPFFTTKPQGSGVGLSLARQIAKLHKGNYFCWEQEWKYQNGCDVEEWSAAKRLSG